MDSLDHLPRVINQVFFEESYNCRFYTARNSISCDGLVDVEITELSHHKVQPLRAN
jgi:hypothetical protein